MDQEQSLESHQPVPALYEQRARLSPSNVGSVYPALQNLQRISHGPGDASVGTTLVNDQFTSQTLPTNQTDGVGQHRRNITSSSNQEGLAVISGPTLPSYPQISREISSSHPASCSSHLDSSLPDILHSHVVQPVHPIRHNQHRQQRSRNLNRRAGEAAPSHHRAHGSRHRRRHRVHSAPAAPTQEGSCKEPCVKCVVVITTFRWVLVVLSILGVFCVVTGIVLAAIRSAGNSFLFLAIMFIGLGVLLVIVVGVGWKCTPRGHEPLHALFGIGTFRHGHSRTRHPRRHRNRDGNWFGGYLYPEFQYRCPPPSYAASMQDYQSQGLSEQDISSTSVTSVIYDAPSSPPPSYRSRASTAHSGIHITFDHEGDLPNSRPPTYRSRAPSRRPSIPIGEVNEGPSATHDGSVSSEPNTAAIGSDNLAQPGSSVVTVVKKKEIYLPSSSVLPGHSGGGGGPSLHHRMASEDRHVLEHTLQSLEEHFNESGGFTNEGARFDEQELPPDFNTYL
ncbi:hypothetical protein BgiMline_004966 [Biomphalaria glabrata]|uniref:Uncharacterized protein LOC106054307 n=1 Tax=Biomphalaria glabrata TaxID=6526 RepID=A0A9W2ZND9_BIOGL|nr:uncharacterized protein LOC106054307 [Biomphalaria glabrata]XP_013065581.2 uncharacterized protein LOC106054307 [Biomphalaria glabrata]XP_013065589.2 uncharacterized protein LOC106054307 [Biomphalaria glabrata]XP_055876578.1 uncharacterized protein LOC106054307 [Biomphalaria glabrata]XP_055876579.1 uncharacterized protein LOC106054307 [Biomphalaria glabrata]XP_055876580.1 uncharacterized protein LOC106054307 [Biomphalaria glabrata]XP_055876581.1 uncharacterized protein LOC106054307 [Biomph